MKTLNSNVSGFEGECTPVWLNKNQVDNLFDGGITGFFKLVEDRTIFGFPFKFRVGGEFHGIIRGGKVETTEGMYK